MAAAPKYSVGDLAYLKESAGVGYIEPININGIVSFNGQWAYTVSHGPMNPISHNTYGDRISMVNRATIYFSETELLTKAEALETAITIVRSKLLSLETQLAAIS